jgi:hypothetical protein
MTLEDSVAVGTGKRVMRSIPDQIRVLPLGSSVIHTVISLSRESNSG